MKWKPSISFFARTALMGVILAFSMHSRAASTEATFLGRWALTIPDGRAGWLEIKRENGWYDGSILWGGGKAWPLASVTIEDDTLTITRIHDVERKGSDGKTVRTHQFTETITARVDGDTLRLWRVAPRPDGHGFDRDAFSGARIPPLPPRPDLAAIRFGASIDLFNGRDLSGWRVIESNAPNGWVVEDGILSNRPVQVKEQPRTRHANIRTEREFEDFNLKLDVRVPEKGNSGVYLRGVYEVQIFDSCGTPPNWHNMGGFYGRITPSVAAEKPAGEWQTFNITLVDRHVTVILNGVKIIDNEALEGCTGGALWSDELRPGPIVLQGDHGPVDFRNFVLRPVLK